MHRLLLLPCLLCTMLAVFGALRLGPPAYARDTVDSKTSVDVDTDGDGLSDFQESHKYFTNPKIADSDGDGTPDGAWDERREYAYTIRTVSRVMRPVSKDLSDDYQDVRTLEETTSWVKVEVIHYPLNTVASALHADKDWRKTTNSMTAETSSTLTSNFDESLSKTLKDKLLADGIDAATLSDKQLVERASQWLLNHAHKPSEAFTGYFTHFSHNKPQVDPRCEREMAKYNRGGRSKEAQWARDLFATSMFELGTRGSCTSSAIYLAGTLRALGLPTRLIYCVPVIDASDPQEMAMLAGIRHPRVRNVVQGALGNLGGAWAGHTFNEVYVGGRWRRLNYSKLGQNTLDPNMFGLVTRVLTVNDWSEARVAETIGARQAGLRRDDIFGHANPYSAVELSDRFGVHGVFERIDMKLESSGKSEKTDTAIRHLTDLAWSDSTVGKRLLSRLGGVAMPRSLLARVKGYDGDFDALKAHQSGGSRCIWLEAKRRAPIQLEMGSGGFTIGGDAWVVFHVPRVAEIQEQTAYKVRADDSARWSVSGVTLTR